MIKDDFIKNSILLTMSNLTTGVLGFIFSIILSRELGAEGMGLYGLIMPVYNLFICLICGGIVTAASKICAEHFAKKSFNNIPKCVNTTMIFNIIWAAFIVTFVLIFSTQISRYIIRDSRTLYAFRITCPAMLFISLSNTLKGYFYGVSNVITPALIDIFEKTVRICILFTISKLITSSSVIYTVTAAYFALCIGEFISLILLYFFYKRSLTKLPPVLIKPESRAQLLFDILVISIPLCINGFVATGLSTASSLILPRRLMLSGISYTSALETIGKYTGMCLNITVFPMIVINSISIILIPDLSQNIIKKDFYSVKKRISTFMNLSLLLGMSTILICTTNGKNLGQMFYSRSDLGSYIKFASLPIPFLFMSSATFSILNGLSRQTVILKNTILMSLLELFLLYTLTTIPSINIYGYSVTMFITSFIGIILNIKEIVKIIDVPIIDFSFLIAVLNFILFYYIIRFAFNLLPDQYIILKNIAIAALGFGFTAVSLILRKFYYRNGY
ncbi:stage V sporulation protein B [Clostridium oryzae]|uniref:Multidrug-efflux transporter n=1 Tax=Clostridium oryzae TaxID=1450648 RepID=A0A1V4II98_9CLOT|nr:stage V sporulation protein B [Clostridium oryzae]OPJ59570.1 stage V sporulation protein B [Clostridium oryzae]